MRNQDDRRQQFQTRVNHRIRVPTVRVIDPDGSMAGDMDTHVALKRARDHGLDLVEVNPKAVPPICKILDYGKFKYDEKKSANEAKKRQMVVELKEIKLRPKTDDHDLAFKIKNARAFLEEGNKVKFTVRFRGREITHPEKAREQLDAIMKALDDVANVETRTMMEQRTMTVILSPKPAVMQKAIQARKERSTEQTETHTETTGP